jgi:hypothetical protein
MKRYWQLGLLALSLACGGKETGPTDGGPATVIVENHYPSLTIGYVYAWDCSAQPNTNDLLGADRTIAPNQGLPISITVTKDRACLHVQIVTLEVPRQFAPRTQDFEVDVEVGKTARVVVDGTTFNPDGFSDEEIS